MKKIIFSGLFFLIPFIYSSAQSGNVVLVEEFTETGCGACAEYDSSFQALINANADKVALINYHCFYALDTFYTYYKACDKRYNFYGASGYPSAMANGKEPGKGSSHLSYVTQSLIDKYYNTAPAFKFEVSCDPTMKGDKRNTNIRIKATALKDLESKDLRLYVAITENNINHEKRYKTKAVNGINEFNHILRAFVPGPDGFVLGEQKKGKANKLKASFINDDKEMDYKEVRVVVYIQDLKTKEVIGTYATKTSPFNK